MIFAFFPLIAAMSYGIAFAFSEHALKMTNVMTYMFLSSCVGLMSIFGLYFLKGERIEASFISDPRSILIVMIAVAAPSLGWLFTLFAVKNTNASYAAFAEISYPLFTVLALFIFFGYRMMAWQTLLGGVLIMIGSCIMVWGQLRLRA